VLTGAIEQSVSADEFAEEAAALDPPIRTREELAYFRIWQAHLRGVRPERNVARFATA
jgi:asparagine synthase (glutamine-hydrolysing)